MAKTPFHDPDITRPQDAYRILVDNSNQPFEHVWMENRDDGQKVHPLIKRKLSALDFFHKDCWDVEPIKPPSIDCTPFKIVEDLKDLKELAYKLKAVQEFAVDLEHNSYRSFQGLTCLMQISTRTEDFVIDTLKLRIYVGPFLRELFKDPTKSKVMHGADGDVRWLQRDFGIYICNLFDTGQASRVLKLERNSLGYLLHHYCGVIADKQYQIADWRLRPLPDEMLRYAREDTHYLLYIYDLMKKELFGLSKDCQNYDNPLLKVYELSYGVCLQLYEKELWTENSFLNIHGLKRAGFNALQLAVASGLHGWRDVVARTEDESTGYVMPNKTLLEIAKHLPITISGLKSLIKSEQPYVEWNYVNIVNIILNSGQNAYAFEALAQELERRRLTAGNEEIKLEQTETHMAQKHANDPGSTRTRCNDQENTNQVRENSLVSYTSVEAEDVSELSSNFERCFQPNNQNKIRTILENSGTQWLVATEATFDFEQVKFEDDAERMRPPHQCD
ncbi:hypothetical protein QN277_013515 [Acacia crassicarpa]|uniref:HRDC domain-containing protein n=1 Tax=Acacia crassicarpa TaxID=499986 RepID=A0AAE1N3U6_9FABA|nr:hypothetical protein QN277_013515 [Acacia crassicarpa]